MDISAKSGSSRGTTILGMWSNKTKTKMKQITLGRVFSIMLLMVGCVTMGQAQNSLTWDLLGTKTVDYGLDRDVIMASNQRSYDAIKIKVNNGMINVHKVTIHFANGETQDVKLPAEMTKENDGKLIDLKGNQRIIQQITFWYDSRNADKSKAVVEVWARK
jgi:virulence-associated protein VagC